MASAHLVMGLESRTEQLQCSIQWLLASYGQEQDYMELLDSYSIHSSAGCLLSCTAGRVLIVSIY